jgi:hypothetical protein
MLSSTRLGVTVVPGPTHQVIDIKARPGVVRKTCRVIQIRHGRKDADMITLLRFARLFAAWVAVALLAGCAFGVRNATLLYPPKADSPIVPQAQAAPEPTTKKVPIALVTFVDQRTDNKAVGTMRNGFGMRTADVLATNSVTEWVTQAVRTDLEKSGYSVVMATGGAPAGAGTVVSGDVLNVFCDMYMSYTGQVSLLMRVSKDGNELATKHYSGEGSAGIAFAGTAESFGESLSLALAAALKKFVADLDATLKAH